MIIQTKRKKRGPHLFVAAVAAAAASAIIIKKMIVVDCGRCTKEAKKMDGNEEKKRLFSIIPDDI